MVATARSATARSEFQLPFGQQRPAGTTPEFKPHGAVKK
ncbi:hypothetical protein ACPOL_4204 [Acidisarcina polymorpha]|uniref:Uncharacterized protein n=1 Tax=Acidisarcina polymorpha TaxID=2211140 RepID=A0A2Z5G2X6_9BACT|nr:hypothetical protein ACPOL_4204 [Acidisarcina polymorpha]